jgi:hypothetical protein
MKIYTISGLGADERVFQYLNIEAEIIPISWLKPFKDEHLFSYAKRMVERIDTSQPFGIMGVSFGGLICVEINKIVNPSLTILISSVETSQELPILYQFIGKTQLIRLIPSFLFNLPKKFAHYFFGSSNILLDHILDDSDLGFTKWALGRLLVWKNDFRLNNCIKIGGSKDRLLPPKDAERTEIVKDGGHFMIIDKAKEISELINKKLRDLNLC